MIEGATQAIPWAKYHIGKCHTIEPYEAKHRALFGEINETGVGRASGKPPIGQAFQSTLVNVDLIYIHP